MNDRGQIAGVGYYAAGGFDGFFWNAGVFSPFDLVGIPYFLDINNKGMVVGYDDGGVGGGIRAFLWQDGVLNDLGGSAGLNGAASAVNERGVVALALATASAYHAFLWERGALTDLGVLGVPTDLNDRGQVVGVLGNGGSGHAFLWDRGQMTDLTPDFDTEFSGESFPVRINNRGQVAGSGGPRPDGTWVPGFFWERGVLTNLGSLGGVRTLVRAINEQGQVVGASQTETGEYHAFFWEHGVMTDLGWGDAFGINERGQVAGVSAGSVFTWQRGVRTDLIDQNGNPVHSGWRVAINNRGQVMGTQAGLAFLWEHGDLMYLQGLEVQTSIGQTAIPRVATALGQESEVAPTTGLPPGRARALLGAPTPNPSSGAAEFAIHLDKDDAVRISLYDAAGRLVASRAPEHLEAGSHSLRWDPGVQKAGLYFARMETGSGAAVVRRWAILR